MRIGGADYRQSFIDLTSFTCISSTFQSGIWGPVPDCRREHAQIGTIFLHNLYPISAFYFLLLTFFWPHSYLFFLTMSSFRHSQFPGCPTNYSLDIFPSLFIIQMIFSHNSLCSLMLHLQLSSQNDLITYAQLLLSLYFSQSLSLNFNWFYLHIPFSLLVIITNLPVQSVQNRRPLTFRLR